MPEGDTIRRLAERIDRRFAGQQVRRCVTRDPRLVGLDLTGRVLLGADAVGKHLLIRFDDGRTLHAHLLMTGSWRVGPAATEPEWHRRIELWLDDGRLTGLDVPLLSMIATRATRPTWSGTSVRTCARSRHPTCTGTANLLRAPDEPLGGALLDQRNVAGWGNLYANELPFIVAVPPFQPVGTIAGLDGLVGGRRRAHPHQRGSRPAEHHRAQADHRRPLDLPKRRTGRARCAPPRSRARLERDVPWHRVTTWCPTCQRAPDLATVDVARARRLLALHPARREPAFPLTAASELLADCSSFGGRPSGRRGSR